MARRKTHEEFVSDVKELTGDEYEVLGKYRGSIGKIEMRHTVCGNIHEYNIKGFLYGAKNRCPFCSNKPQIKDESILLENFKDFSKNRYTLLSSYTSATQKIKIKHNVCGLIREVRGDVFLDGKSKCPRCSGREKFSKQMIENMFSEIGVTLKIAKEFSNRHSEITVINEECGHIYTTTPKNLVRTSGCPLCKGSKGEKRIEKFLIRNKVSYSIQQTFKDLRDKYPLRFDFGIYKCGRIICLVEYDGEQHFEPVDFFGGERELHNTQHRDRIKDKYCADNGIPLIRIPYWEYDNIDAILTEKLLPLLKDNNVNPTQKQAVGM